jgi:hypothetical protein
LIQFIDDKIQDSQKQILFSKQINEIERTRLVHLLTYQHHEQKENHFEQMALVGICLH